MRWWFAVVRRGFRRYSTYTGATLAGAFTNTVFGLIRAYVFLAVFRHRPEIGGYDAADVVTYAFLTQAMLAAVDVFGVGLDIGERVRSGDIAGDLYRPVDFQGYWLALDLGRAGFQTLARGLPPLAVGMFVFDLRLPTDAIMWITLPLTVALAVVVSFAIRFLVALTSFWILDIRGPNAITMTAVMFFSGFVVPVRLFPAWLRDVAEALPFVAMVQLPVDVFLGKVDSVAGALATQALWAVLLLATGRLVLRLAERKLVVQGG